MSELISNAPVDQGLAEVRERTRWERFKNSAFWYSFTRDKVAMVCALIFALFVGAALLAPILAPTNPYDLSTIDIMDSELAPFLGRRG